MDKRTKIKDTNYGTNIVDVSQEEIALKINQEAMNMIIDRLTDTYAHKIPSIVREITSNAIDACVVGGEGSHFIIHKPTFLEPVFSVEDFGCGMDIEDLRNIYTQYGASTKVLDMEQIGAYGLGAKAPLCYTDSFTITTTKNGETIIGILSRKDGVSALSIVSREKTNNHNGTTITIPLNSTDDIDEFVEAIDNNYGLFVETVPCEFEIK